MQHDSADLMKRDLMIKANCCTGGGGGVGVRSCLSSGLLNLKKKEKKSDARKGQTLLVRRRRTHVECRELSSAHVLDDDPTQHIPGRQSELTPRGQRDRTRTDEIKDQTHVQVWTV